MKIEWRRVSSPYLRTVAESADLRFIVMLTDDGVLLRDRRNTKDYPARTVLQAKEIGEFLADGKVG